MGIATMFAPQAERATGLDDLPAENRAYWTGRASGYSEVNRTELEGPSRAAWGEELVGMIETAFPGRAHETIRVLDVGTGPGFFAIVLAEAGFCVTAVDYTPGMLAQAEENARTYLPREAAPIRFLRMDAEALAFPDRAFDVVVSRNLTWNLPHPERAYAQWLRVLDDGGMLLNFDANWYSYLFDPAARVAYEADRANTADAGVKDEYLCTDIDAMEAIARRVPLGARRRPAWDVETLARLGAALVSADETAWERVWTPEERVNFAATPLFEVCARKAARR